MKTNLIQQKVLLVDDHPVFRDGLKSVVESHPQLRVVAEASSADEAMDKLQMCSPDFLITDLRLASSCGHDLIQQALAVSPGLMVVVVSVNSQSADVVRAIESGASAYLTKGASREEILRALSEVLEGRSFLHAEVAHVLFNRVRKPKSSSEELLEVTPREQEVLELLCLGKTPRDIGDSLFMSVSTVKTHVRNLYRKLNVSSRTQLVLKALELKARNSA
ncbi:response regulator transcription factor [bacterium]|nr:response regulator transcription factor [bacterium]